MGALAGTSEHQRVRTLRGGGRGLSTPPSPRAAFWAQGRRLQRGPTSSAQSPTPRRSFSGPTIKEASEVSLPNSASLPRGSAYIRAQALQMARRHHVFDALGLPRLYVARCKFNPIEPPSTDPALAFRRLGPAPCKSGKSPAAGEKAAGLPESPHARLGTRRVRWSSDCRRIPTPRVGAVDCGQPISGPRSSCQEQRPAASSQGKVRSSANAWCGRTLDSAGVYQETSTRCGAPHEQTPLTVCRRLRCARCGERKVYARPQPAGITQGWPGFSPTTQMDEEQ
jgi:hypothetical protein